MSVSDRVNGQGGEHLVPDAILGERPTTWAGVNRVDEHAAFEAALQSDLGEVKAPQRYVSEARPGTLGVQDVAIPEDDDGSSYPGQWATSLRR